MRPVNRDEGLTKLRSLKCFNEVHERVLSGWAPSELARFIQETRNEYGHANRISLMQVLQRYRDSIPPAQLLAKRMPQAFQKAAEEVEEGVDELKELNKLYRLQMGRIDIDLLTEKKINKLMPTMTQEVRVAAELLGKIADLKMDLGLSTRHLGQVDAEVTITTDPSKYGRDSVQKVMQDPERRRKVLNVAERILGLPGRSEKTQDPEEVLRDAVAEVAEFEMVAADELNKDKSPDPEDDE